MNPSDLSPDDHARLLQRIEAEVLDGCDEELELEMEDRDPGAATSQSDRLMYFRRLCGLQGERVRLQDWVAATGTRWSSRSKGATRPAKSA